MRSKLNMSYRIVEIPELSGECCKIYSISYDGEEDTLLDKFMDTYTVEYDEAVEELWKKLKFIGNEGGAREQFFRIGEGRPGDGVVALLKRSGFSLRLYGIRYGNCLLIVGSGGIKSKGIRSWQDDPVLKQSATEMIAISEAITKRIKDKEIKILADGSLEGDLLFE